MSTQTPVEKFENGWARARTRREQDPVASLAAQRAELEALDWFEARLGSDWPGWHGGYPLAALFGLTYRDVTSEQQNNSEGVRVRRLAQAFEGEAALDDIVRRIGHKQWRDHYTALAELELAATFQLAGFATTLVCSSPGGNPSADFQLSLCGRPIDCECTALVASSPEQKADEVMDRLFFLPRQNRMLVRPINVHLERGATAVDAYERFAELEAAMVAASVHGTTEHVANLASISPFGGPDHVPTVAVHGGLVVGTIEKPLTQLQRSIRKKIEHGQLQGQRPGLLFVKTKSFSLFAGENFELWLEAIAEAAHSCFAGSSSVSAIVVHEGWRGSPAPRVSRETGERAFVAGTNARGSSRFLVLTLNPGARWKLSREESELLVSSNMIW